MRRSPADDEQVLSPSKRAKVDTDALKQIQRSTVYVRAIESFGVRARFKDDELVRFVEGFNHCQGQATLTALRGLLGRPEDARPQAMTAAREYAAEQGGELAAALGWILDVAERSMRTPEVASAFRIVDGERTVSQKQVSITITTQTRVMVLEPFASPWVEPPPPPPDAVEEVPRLPPMAPIHFEVQSMTNGKSEEVQLDLLQNGGATTLHRYDALFACLVSITTMLRCPFFLKHTPDVRVSMLGTQRNAAKESIRVVFGHFLTAEHAAMAPLESELQAALDAISSEALDPEIGHLRARIAEFDAQMKTVQQELADFDARTWGQSTTTSSSQEEEEEAREMALTVGKMRRLLQERLDRATRQRLELHTRMEQVSLPR